MNRQDRTWQAPFGMVVDFFELARFRFATMRSLNKFRQIHHEAKRVRAKTLIETGTYLGVTTRRCARVFDRVLSIELDPKLAQQASAYLADLRHVEVLQGDAVEWLPKLLERPDVDSVFLFLDAHFSSGVTACGDEPEPALLELDVIARHIGKVRGFVIDDFRSFGLEPGFPKKSELLSACERLFPGFDLRVHLDQVIVTAPIQR